MVGLPKMLDNAEIHLKKNWPQKISESVLASSGSYMKIADSAKL